MSTVKTTYLQNASASSPNITLDANNNATFAGTVVTSSPMTMRNKIINGAMEIDQRNAGAAVTINVVSDIYTVDRFSALGQATDGVFTVQQVADAPSGFANSAKITVTTADAFIASGQTYRFEQRVEGYNIIDLAWGTSAAKPVTLSFWIKSSITGNFGGSLRNSGTGGNYVYPFGYAINAANTWEYKTITITAPTAGTWLTNNGVGIIVHWSLGAAADRQGTVNQWTTSFTPGATGQANIISTNGATWQITGVQLEAGTIATPFEKRNYQQELAMCQRYYQQFMAAGVGSRDSSNSNGTLLTPFQFLVQMRVAPTCDSTLNGGSADGEAQARNYPGQAGWTFERITDASAIFNALLPGGVGTTANVPWRCKVPVKASAEL